MDANEFRQRQIEVIEPTLLDYLAILWRRRWAIGAFTALIVLVTAGTLWLRPSEYEAEAIVAVTPESFARRVILLVNWKLGVPRVRVGDKREEFLVRLVATGTSPAADLDDGVAWIERQRRRVPVLLPLPSEPETVSLGPSLDDALAPSSRAELPPGPIALPPLPPTPPRDADVAAWARELVRIETELPGLPAQAAPYWTSVAVELRGKIQMAREATQQRVEAVRERPRVEAAHAEAARVRRLAEAVESTARRRADAAAQKAVVARAEVERHNATVRAWVPDQVEVLRRAPVKVVPTPWLYSLSVSLIAGLVLASAAALVMEWWSRELAARRGRPETGSHRGLVGPSPHIPAPQSLGGRGRPGESGWVP